LLGKTDRERLRSKCIHSHRGVVGNFRRRAGGVVAASLFAVAGLVVAAPAATADVLVNTPRTRVCHHGSLKVGVWYQSFSGGPRQFRINVYGPSGRRVFHQQGRASARHWRFWRIRARRLGRYRTVYRGSTGNRPWRAVFRTRSVRC